VEPGLGVDHRHGANPQRQRASLDLSPLPRAQPRWRWEISELFSLQLGKRDSFGG
jgi:hypothetical protein